MVAATVEATDQDTEAGFDDFRHTGPVILMGSYLRTVWHPAYIAEQLKPGCAVPGKTMNEPFTLYLRETGTAHAVDLR